MSEKRERARERPLSLLVERAILAGAAVSEQYSKAKGTGGAQSPDEDTTRWAVDRSAKAGGSRTAEDNDLPVAATQSTSQIGNKSGAKLWCGVAVVRLVPGC